MTEHKWRGIPIETEETEHGWVAKVVHQGGWFVLAESLEPTEERAVAEAKRELDSAAALINPALEQRVRELEVKNARLLSLEATAKSIESRMSKADDYIDVLEEQVRKLSGEQSEELKRFLKMSQQLDLCFAEFGDETIDGKCLCTSCAEHVQAWSEALDRVGGLSIKP